MSYTVTITPTAYDASIDNTTYTVSIGNSVQPISSFLDLLDVDPTTYSGQAGKVVQVNSGEDGLEFGTAGGGSGDMASATYDPASISEQLVGLTATQTLTNKTLTSPNINEAVALTATATELNILDGATLSTTELNYVDGVTSAIQTQIDAKLSDITGESINSLTDVNITTVADGEILVYDNGTSDWINQTLAEAGVSAVGHTHTASEITDFDTEVANNSAVALNTAKVTNATHTGQVTGSGALTVDVTAITDQTLVTAVGADTVLIVDATDGQLKKALISDFASAGGDMASATYDPASIAEQLVGLTATQTLTNKTLTQPTIVLKQGTAPTPTAEGDIQWDTDDDTLKVGDGTGTLVFSDDSVIAATYAPIANPTFTGEIGIGSVNVSETELGILEGATLTTTELNYVDGVTSAIQTQIDGKLSDITGENIQDLSNVTITTLGADELLFTQDGSTWINQTLAEAGIQAILTEGAFANGDKTKLDGIEAGADVTDTANVTAAGALMDSEVTNLAQVKAFDSADYATAAQGATADSALQDVVDDTTPQLGGDVDYNSNGLKITGQTVGGSNGDVVYLSGSNTWSQADADAESTAGGVLGLKISASEVLLEGVYTTSGLTAGTKYYLSATAGGITSTAPSTTGQIVRVVGYALTTTEFLLKIHESYVEVA